MQKYIEPNISFTIYRRPRVCNAKRLITNMIFHWGKYSMISLTSKGYTEYIYTKVIRVNIQIFFFRMLLKLLYDYVIKIQKIIESIKKTQYDKILFIDINSNCINTISYQIHLSFSRLWIILWKRWHLTILLDLFVFYLNCIHIRFNLVIKYQKPLFYGTQYWLVPGFESDSLS